MQSRTSFGAHFTFKTGQQGHHHVHPKRFFLPTSKKETKKKNLKKTKNSLESAQNPIEQRLAHLIARVGIIERQSDKKLIFDINVVLGARYRIDISLVDALFYVVRVQEASRPSAQAAQHLFSRNFVNNQVMFHLVEH